MTEQSGATDKMGSWNRLGLDFNPFEHLEASEDPRLGLYLVERAGLTHIWEDGPAIMYAESGAGKTALRLHAERLCWSHPYAGPLPVTYLLLPSSLQSGSPTINDHYRVMARSMARSLFLAILLRPARLLNAEPRMQKELGGWLNGLLPANLNHYVKRMESDGTTRAVIGRFDKNQLFTAPTHPPQLFEDLLVRLTDIASSPLIDQEPTRSFQRLTEIALHELNFRSIFLMIDGLDGTAETYLNPSAAYRWLAPLWMRVEQLTIEQVYFKGFFPLEMDISAYGPSPSALWTFSLEWTEPTLAEMLRKRIYVASGGKFGSLDAISTPLLRDVETQMVRLCASALPREQLRFADMVLNRLVRKEKETPQLLVDDLHHVKTLYEFERSSLRSASAVAVTDLAVEYSY